MTASRRIKGLVGSDGVNPCGLTSMGSKPRVVSASTSPHVASGKKLRGSPLCLTRGTIGG